MKQQRVIHLLSDGRRKYSTHHGILELWSGADIEAMKSNRRRFGNAAFTADFSAYDVTYNGLRERFPDAELISVVGFETEDHDRPLQPDVIR